MIFELNPTIKCGEFNFYAERANVRLHLGKFKTFVKSKTSENSTDDFGFCHTYYDVSDCLIAIEFFPEADLLYDGIALFKQKPDKLTDILKLKDTAVYADDYSIMSKKLGICAEIGDGQVKSILVCTDNYYD